MGLSGKSGCKNTCCKRGGDESLFKNKKGYFFTVDAIIASGILLLAVIILSYSTIEEVETSTINYIAEDTIKSLSELKIGEINNSVTQRLVSDGNLTEDDYNRSILEYVSILWAEGKNDSAAALLDAILLGIVPDGYSLQVLAEDDELFLVNLTDPENLVSYQMFVTGVEPGKTIRGFISKVFFQDIESKASSSYLFFGGYVGEGNISTYFELPKNITITGASLEVDTGNNFDLYINENSAGSYTKGMGGGGYMNADSFSLNSYTGYFTEGINSIKINFSGSGNFYIGGGFLKVSYKTSTHEDPNLEYQQGYAVRKQFIPGIDGVINLYDSFYVPGKLNSLDVVLNYSSNYTTYMTIGNTTVWRTTTDGVHSVHLTDADLISEFANNNVDYNSFTNATVPFRVGLEDVEFVGITGATDTILVTDTSGSMGWYSDPYINVTSSTTSNSWVEALNFYIEAPPTKNFILDTDVDFMGGTVENLTSNGGVMTLTQSGPTVNSEIITQTNSDGTRYLRGSVVRAQSFLATSTGDLTDVVLRMRRYYGSNSFVMELRNYNAATNTVGSLIDSVVKPYYDIGTSYHEETFSFSGTPTLTAGQSYAIVVYVQGYSTSSQYYIYRENQWPEGPYLDGEYFYSGSGIGGLTEYDDYDFYFRVFMNTQGYASSGTATYQYDAGQEVNWNDFVSSTSEPSGTNLQIEFRTSNDTVSWSGWDNDITNLVDSRYIQERITMTSSGSNSPSVDYAEVVALNDTSFVEIAAFEASMYWYGEPGRSLDMAVVSPTNDWYYENDDWDHALERISGSEVEYGTWRVYVRQNTYADSVTDYSLTIQVLPERIDVAKEGDIQFVKKLLNNSANRVGLVAYDSNVYDSDVQPLTSDNVTLINEINSYSDGGGTCICCGINRAISELPADGNRFIVMMSDGDATSSCGGSPVGDALAAGVNACNQDIRVFTIGFGSGISPQGTQTLKDIACNETDYFNAQSSDALISILGNISKQILGISYTKQSVNITGVLDQTFLHPDSYLLINYTPYSNPLSHGDIFVSGDFSSFGNSITTGEFYLPSGVAVLDTKVSSYSAEKWTSNITIKANNETDWKKVFMLEDYSDSFSELGDPFMVYINPDLIVKDINNSVNIRTGIGPGNISGGSVDDTVFYTLVLSNFAESPVIGSVADGCEWELEFDDGTTKTLKIPADYAGSNMCYYKNATYDQNDSINSAAYELFSQLDFANDGTLSVKFEDGQLQADLSVIDNVPTMWGPSVTKVRVWR